MQAEDGETRKISLSVFLVLIVAFPVTSMSHDKPFNLLADGEVFSSAIGVPMTVSLDGKPTYDMIVSYTISKIHGSWEVAWDSVNIDSAPDGKVGLSVRHYSTIEGSIRNVKVGRASASFDIVFTGFSSGEEMHIVVPKNEHGIPAPEIRASRFYRDFSSCCSLCPSPSFW